MTVAYLMLHGNGWTQRWGIVPGLEEQERAQLFQVGTNTTGKLAVVDPGSDSEATLVVAWAQQACTAIGP